MGTNLISQEKQTKDSRRPPCTCRVGIRGPVASHGAAPRGRAPCAPPTGWTTRPRPAKLWPGPRQGHLFPRQRPTPA